MYIDKSIKILYKSKYIKGDNSMKNIMLTSNSFANKNIGELFIKMVNKDPSQIKLVFVPTAANIIEAIEFLHLTANAILELGISSDNIFIYDLHYKMEYDELIKYDAIHFCGGDPAYLLKRINETGFNEPLNEYVNNGGVYVGVSAGSIITANNLQNNLGYLNCELDVHGNEGIDIGKFEQSQYSKIHLPDNRAIIIKDNECEVIE